jgi:hypothetical protein
MAGLVIESCGKEGGRQPDESAAKTQDSAVRLAGAALT